MALTPIVKPLYPHVPKLPGVPALVRNAASPVQAVTAFRGIAIGYLQRFITTESKWGIYSNEGKKLIDADSFLSFEISKESKISTYPILDGGFTSFNKVTDPYEIVVQVTKSGSLNVLDEARNLLNGGGFGRGGDTQRAEFIESIESLYKSLDLVTVVTPEKTYLSANAKRYAFKRSQSNGAYQITAEIVFEEVRQANFTYALSTTPKIIEPKSPEAAPPVNQGKVSPKQPDRSLLKRIFGS